MTPTVGITSFFCTHCRRDSGNSYMSQSHDALIALVQAAWDKRQPGQGETDLTRKIVVPIDISGGGFFCPPRVPLQAGMPLKAEVKVRQDGEDPYVEVYIDSKDASRFGFEEIPACYCDVVCYSADSLLENGGSRSTDCDWEIVTLICKLDSRSEPMIPLAMARNFLEKPGGTKGVYSAKEFADAIYYHASRGVRVRIS